MILTVLGVGIFPPLFHYVKDWLIGDASAQGFALCQDIFFTTLFSLSITVLLFFGNTYIFNQLQKKLPWRNNVSKRIVLEILLVLSYSTLTIATLSFLFFETFPYALPFSQFLTENVVFANTLTIIIILIYEGVFLFRAWKRTLLQTEHLEKEQMRSQYKSLKDQVNPHFLFNSLNALTSLVHKDSDKAEQFILQLSKVYRYVLDNGEAFSVELKEELAFLESYFFLHQIRFGANIELKLDLDASTLQRRLPPLTLQLLVENAIKHNIVSSEKPLIIELFVKEDLLVVKNNLQLRGDREESSGIGLKNLKERYRLLSGLVPEFKINGVSYEAKVPLLEVEVME